MSEKKAFIGLGEVWGAGVEIRRLALCGIRAAMRAIALGFSLVAILSARRY